MKTKLFFSLTCIIFFSTNLFAQLTGNAIIFTEKGERFIAVLNGVRQNQDYQTNVKLENLNAEFYKLKILFQNNAAKPANVNLHLKRGYEITYNLKRNSKGKYVLRFTSEAPLPPPAPPVVANPAAPASNGTNINNGTQINMPVNVNVNVGSGTQVIPPSQPATPQAANQPNGMPMTNADFQAAKQSISSKSFEDSKLQMAKQIASSNSLLASQVKEIMKLFSFEESRLDFAKFAYKSCINKGNYFEVNDVFQFEMSIEDLNQYITANR